MDTGTLVDTGGISDSFYNCFSCGWCPPASRAQPYAGSGQHFPVVVQTVWKHLEAEILIHGAHTGVSWSVSSMRPSLHGGVSLTASGRSVKNK